MQLQPAASQVDHAVTDTLVNQLNDVDEKVKACVSQMGNTVTFRSRCASCWALMPAQPFGEDSDSYICIKFFVIA